MKRFVMLSLALGAMIVLAANVATAQYSTTPCDNVCQEPWIQCTWPLVNNSDDGCSLLIYYSYQICNGMPMIKIDRIEPIGPACDGENNFPEYIENAFRQAVQDARSIFPYVSLSPPDTTFHFTLLAPACWHWDYVNSVVPCNSECCIALYHVLWDDNNCAYITRTELTEAYCHDPLVQGGCWMSCETMEFPRYKCILELSPLCHDVCNYINVLSTNYYGKMYDPDENMFNVIFDLYHCNGTNYELQITNVDYTDKWSTLTPQQAIARAVEGALYKIGKMLGTGIYRVIINMQSCFRDYPFLLNGTVPAHCLMPCLSDCCESVHDITVDANGNISSVLVTPINFQPNCPEPIPACSIQACIPYIMNDSEASQRYGVNENISSFETTYIKPNPTTGKTDIYFNSDITGNLSLSVYDIIGNTVITAEINKTQHECVFNIDASLLADGVYNFRITTEGIIIATGRFVVSH
jgi:hypothetical protein